MSYADEHAPKSIIEDGKVINHEQLKRYWAGVAERKDRIQRGTFWDLRDSVSEATEQPTAPREVIHRYSNMGAKEFRQLQDTAGQLENHIQESQERKPSTNKRYKTYEGE